MHVKFTVIDKRNLDLKHTMSDSKILSILKNQTNDLLNY